jgi:transposase InsO family protein
MVFSSLTLCILLPFREPTPCNIEAWHSRLEKELLKRTWFDSIYHSREKLAAYYLIYNHRRKHRSLKRKSPYLYLKTFYPDFAD